MTRYTEQYECKDSFFQPVETVTARISFNAFADTVHITLIQRTNTRHSLFTQSYHKNQRKIDHDGHFVTCKLYSWPCREQVSDTRHVSTCHWCNGNTSTYHHYYSQRVNCPSNRLIVTTCHHCYYLRHRRLCHLYRRLSCQLHLLVMLKLLDLHWHCWTLTDRQQAWRRHARTAATATFATATTACLVRKLSLAINSWYCSVLLLYCGVPVCYVTIGNFLPAFKPQLQLCLNRIQINYQDYVAKYCKSKVWNCWFKVWMVLSRNRTVLSNWTVQEKLDWTKKTGLDENLRHPARVFPNRQCVAILYSTGLKYD